MTVIGEMKDQEIDRLQQRLNRIRNIIIDVDQRCMACDGPVTPTHEEITLDEVRRIFALACGQPETWRP
jgi:hypothetical protein